MKQSFFIFLMLFSVNLFAQNENLKYGCETKIRWVQIDDRGDFRTHVKPFVSYYADKAWVETEWNFYNAKADTFNGFVLTNIDKAVIGYQLNDIADYPCFLQVGRLKMDDTFESKLQFNSMYNGIHFCIKKDNFSLHGGPFMNNTKEKHIGVIGEVTFDKIKDLPVSLSYSLTNWYPEMAYTISQITAKYHFVNIQGHPVTCYAAYLRNHRINSESNGFYLGATLGKVEKAKDYLVDVSYQYAEDSAIPSIDRKGGTSFNKSGIEAKIVYAVTDMFKLQGKFLIADTSVADISAIFTW